MYSTCYESECRLYVLRLDLYSTYYIHSPCIQTNKEREGMHHTLKIGSSFANWLLPAPIYDNDDASLVDYIVQILMEPDGSPELIFCTITISDA